MAMTAVIAAQAPRTGLLQERGLTAADFPQFKKLADNVYVWSDVHPNGIYTTNDLIVVTSEGVLVADGQKDVATTKKMVDKIATLTQAPIKYVVVASEHGDHTGGNEAFPKTATFITSPVSQPNVKQPTETVATERTISMGGEQIRILNEGPAHTGGDLEVYLPKEKILFTSEVFSNHIFPNMRSAPPSGWVQTIRKVRQIDASMIVPGHGFIDDPAVMRDELAQYEKALAYIVAEVTRLHATGVDVATATKQVNWGPYATWPVADRNGPTAIQRVYDELDGKLK